MALTTSAHACGLTLATVTSRYSCSTARFGRPVGLALLPGRNLPVTGSVHSDTYISPNYDFRPIKRTDRWRLSLMPLFPSLPVRARVAPFHVGAVHVSTLPLRRA